MALCRKLGSEVGSKCSVMWEGEKQYKSPRGDLLWITLPIKGRSGDPSLPLRINTSSP